MILPCRGGRRKTAPQESILTSVMPRAYRAGTKKEFLRARSALNFVLKERWKKEITLRSVSTMHGAMQI